MLVRDFWPWPELDNSFLPSNKCVKYLYDENMRAVGAGLMRGKGGDKPLLYVIGKDTQRMFKYICTF